MARKDLTADEKLRAKAAAKFGSNGRYNKGAGIKPSVRNEELTASQRLRIKAAEVERQKQYEAFAMQRQEAENQRQEAEKRQQEFYNNTYGTPFANGVRESYAAAYNRYSSPYSNRFGGLRGDENMWMAPIEKYAADKEVERLEGELSHAEDMHDTYSGLYGSWQTSPEEKAEAFEQKNRFAGQIADINGGALVDAKTKQAEATANYYATMNRRPGFNAGVAAGEAIDNGFKTSEIEGTVTNWEFFTDAEKDIYNYLLGTGGEEAAEAYWKYMLEPAQQRLGNIYTDRVQSIDPGLGRFLAERAYGIAAGVENALGGFIQAITEEELPTSGTQFGYYQMGEGKTGLDKITYELGYQAGNMLPSMLLSGGLSAAGAPAKLAQLAGSGAMGFSAGGNAYKQGLDMGMTTEQAKAYGRLIGASEGGLQYVLGGISALGGTSGKFAEAVKGIENGFLRFIAKTGGSMVSEATEEGLQGILEPIFNALISGGDVNVDWSEVAYSALMGALMGGLFEAPGNAVEAITAGRGDAMYTPNSFRAENFAFEGLMPANVSQPGESGNSAEIRPDSPGLAQAREQLRQSALATAEKNFGREGYSAFEEEAASMDNPADLFGEMARAYNDGLVNRHAKSFGRLTESQYERMFAAGRSDAVASVRSQMQNRRRVYSYKDAGIDMSDAATKEHAETLSKEDAKALNNVSKAFGVKIRFADSVAGGGANAEIKKGIITIEKGNPRPLRFLFGHEITHRLQELAPKEYAKLRAAVAAYATEFNAKTGDMMMGYAEKNRSITQDAAVDEVIANELGLKLEDNAELERFIARFSGERTLLERLKDVIREIRVMLVGTEHERRLLEVEKRLDKAAKAAAKQAQSNAGVTKNAAVAQKTDDVKTESEDGKLGIKDSTAKKLDARGLTVQNGVIVSKANAALMQRDGYFSPNDRDRVRYSIKTEPAWRKNYLALHKGKDAERVANVLRTFTERMIANDAIFNYVPNGDYSYSKFGPLRDNMEYIFTFDMDTSCPRTFQFLNYRNALRRIAGRELTYNESVNLLELMRAYGQQIPCAYCYVENKRILLSASYNNFFKFRQDVMNAATDEEALTKMYSYDPKKGKVSGAAQKVFERWRGDTSYNPSVTEVWTATNEARNAVLNYLDAEKKAGRASAYGNMKALLKTVYDRFGVTDAKSAEALEMESFVNDWVYDTKAKVKHIYNIPNSETIPQTVDLRALRLNREALAYSKSASSAKTVENYTPYTDQLKNVSEEDRDYILGMGGIRKHSSNDFRVDYVQDYFLFYADLAAGKWTGHTYTKSVDFAKIFGRTGDRINMSVAFYGDSKEALRQNIDEGAPWRDVKEIRKNYKDVGSMAMVTNDAQLSYALNADWIDMIIPFHASGLDKAVWYDLRMWQDYTSKQSERFKNADDMKSELTAAGIIFDKKASADDIRALYNESFGIKQIFTYDKEGNLKLDKNGNPVLHKPHFFPGDTYVDGQLVPGHGNNPQRYFELCQEYGVHPRFKGVMVEDSKGRRMDVTEHPGYIKLIKETSRIDSKQSPIEFNLDQYDEFLGMSPMDYAFKRMEEEAKNGGFENTKEDPYGIVKEFAEEYIGKDRPLGYLTERAKATQDIINQGYQEMAYKDGEMVGEETGAKLSLKGSDSLAREIKRIQTEGAKAGRSDADIQTDIRAAVQEAYQSMVNTFGAIDPGENAYREVQVPSRTAKKKKVSKTVRTAMEAQATPDMALPKMEELVATGEFSYEVYGDKAAVADAREYVENKGWDTSLSEWLSDVRKGVVSKRNTAVGWLLYDNAVNNGNVETAMTILYAMVEHQRNAAQAVQATRILKKLSPETQLYGVQRSIANLQQEINDRHGKKRNVELVIDQALADDFVNARTQEERDEALREIYRDIGRQMPSSFIDKFRAWRYLAMLGNPRTHGRNIAGNAAFAPVVLAKDLTASAIESAVYRLSGGKMGRSKTLVIKQGTLKAAWQDYKNVADMVSGEGKYSDYANANRYIEEGRQVFKFKPLEKARRGNTKSLEAEDMWFSRPHYAFALAQYCSVNGISAEQIRSGKGLDKAREYAAKEAQKATYRDTNQFSQAISHMGFKTINGNMFKKGANAALEGVLPFRKTPANILVRGLEYSPLGLVNGIKQAVWDVQKGNMTASEAIDNISAGLTGTGLLALGVYLAAQGLIRGRGSDDEKEKEFEELMGHQGYALETPDGKSYTLDWLAPEALPFFIGVNLYEQVTAKRENNEAMQFKDVLAAVRNVTEPMLSMSCLQSLNDLFEAVGYASSNDMNALMTMLSTAATSYLSQALPTIAGQIERIGETERMTTYTEKNSPFSNDMQYFFGRVSGKTPGEFQQIPYIDAWGRTESTGAFGERAFNNLINPAYTSQIEMSAMEEMLLRLYNDTGEASVLPSRAGKYFNVDKVRKDLTAEEYVKYATEKGKLSYNLLTGMMVSEVYTGLSSADQVDAVEKVYEYANAIAKTGVSNYKLDGWVAKANKAITQTGIKPEVYIPLYVAQGNVESLKDKNGETISNSKSLQVMQLVYATPGLTDKQRKSLFEAFDVSEGIRHYNKALVEQKLREMQRKAK